MKKAEKICNLILIILIIICVIAIFAVLHFSFGIGKVEKKPTEQYTVELLEDCTIEDFETVEIIDWYSRKNKSGFYKDGEWLTPISNNDHETIYIIDKIVRSEAKVYIPMHQDYEVDDEEIEARVKVIAEKFPDRKIYIDTKDFYDEHGNLYQDKAICIEKVS